MLTNEEIKFKAIYNPALNIDYFLVQSFDGLNKLPNPKKPSFQMMVDFNFILKQIPGQYKTSGVPIFMLTFLAAIGILLTNPKIQSLNDYKKSL